MNDHQPREGIEVRQLPFYALTEQWYPQKQTKKAPYMYVMVHEIVSCIMNARPTRILRVSAFPGSRACAVRSYTGPSQPSLDTNPGDDLTARRGCQQPRSSVEKLAWCVVRCCAMTALRVPWVCGRCCTLDVCASKITENFPQKSQKPNPRNSQKKPLQAQKKKKSKTAKNNLKLKVGSILSLHRPSVV